MDREGQPDSAGTDVILTSRITLTATITMSFETYNIRSIVKKYSDYIRYPIKMEVRRGGQEGRDEFESYFEIETLNSMIPIWRKNKSELSDEDYNYFYKENFSILKTRCGSYTARLKARSLITPCFCPRPHPVQLLQQRV